MTDPDSKKILQNLPQYYYVIDCSTFKIVESNDKNIKPGKSYCYNIIFGLNKHCSDLGIDCLCKRIVKEKKALEITHQFKPDNTCKTYKVLSTPIFDKNGKVTHALSQYIDITNKNKLKNKIKEQNKKLLAQNEEYESLNYELRENQEKYRRLTENSPDITYIYSLKRGALYWSSRVNDILGFEPDNLLKNPLKWINSIYKEDKEKVKKLFENIQVGKTYYSEYRIYDIKKNLHWFNDRIFNVYKQNGDIILEGLSSDITEQKLAELAELKNERKLKKQNEEYSVLNEELEKNIDRMQIMNNNLQLAKEKAEECDRLKSAFLANMSHELRTPLNGIIGFSALLRKIELDNDTIDRYSEIIETSGHRLVNIVNDLFDISLIQSNQLKFENEKFEINSLLDDIYIFYNTTQEYKLQKIKFELVRNSEAKIKIHTDKYRLHQIFKNLIDNAFKFTSEGNIEFGYLPIENNHITFYIKDTGIGIPDEYQKTIFIPFRQVDDSITRDHEGGGLGLSIVSGLLEQMGGKIRVESQKNMGATFYFTIPIDLTDKLKDEIDSGQKHLLKNKMILIVEDDLVCYEFLKIFLQNIGSGGIIQTSNGEDAVNIVNSNKIDLIFMDIRLPGINGYETTKQIREINKKVKIIAQTAFVLQNDREESIAAGCDDYISKPINKTYLLRIIEKYFG